MSSYSLGPFYAIPRGSPGLRLMCESSACLASAAKQPRRATGVHSAPLYFIQGQTEVFGTQVLSHCIPSSHRTQAEALVHPVWSKGERTILSIIMASVVQ